MTLPPDPAALTAAVFRRLLWIGLAITLLLLAFGPLAVLLVGLAGLAWWVWRNGFLPPLPSVKAPGWMGLGLALLALALLLSGGGLFLLVILGLALVAVGAIGPARLRAGWALLRAFCALACWLAEDAPRRLRALRDLLRGLQSATSDAAAACRPAGAARAPVDGLGTAITGLRVPVPKVTREGEVTLLDIGKAEVKLPVWRIEPGADTATPAGAAAVTAAVRAAGEGLDAAAGRLDALAEGFGVAADALDAAVAALPPEG